MVLEVPQIITNLDSCKQIVEERPLSPEELAARAATAEEQRQEEEYDQEEIFDPEDPLYGLD